MDSLKRVIQILEDMFHYCVMELEGKKFLFSHTATAIRQVSKWHNMKLCMEENAKPHFIGSIRVTRDCLKLAFDWKISYEDLKRKDIEFHLRRKFYGLVENERRVVEDFSTISERTEKRVSSSSKSFVASPWYRASY
ncbi:putative protein isoform X1 [Gossypium australe]|uniref:Uncharacterized protein n=1 Tax=Gossypium australe TaxID=47621 RepID=A0A5B6WGE5_9ROSI|nr:putative protein isoform X1 [Gossypium australe]